MAVSQISSPYNFVPLSKKILYPDWADRVSHDIPFSDGLDGELNLRIEAVTDIFIRNASPEKGQKETEFFHVTDGEYYIPATSIKGMIRSVMEIASYGKMQHITDKRYAIRDLKLKTYRDLLCEKDLKSKVKAGFLDISSPDWRIYPCKYGSFLRSQINDRFGNKSMSAAEKYRDYLSLKGTLRQRANITWFEKKTALEQAKGVPHWDAELRDDGEYPGWLIFTGQPQAYNPSITKNNSQKRREFFFYDVDEEMPFYVDDPETLKTNEFGDYIRPNQEDFRFIHCEQLNSNDFNEWENGSLKEVRKKYFNGRIPVFYICENGIFRFGLAQMFRFAGLVSTAEALRNTNPEHYLYRNEQERFKPDMADLVFGYSTSDRSLRGRVQFSPCKALDYPVPQPEQEIILDTPKPTFYPSYIKQPEDLLEKKVYKTFLDKDAELRGWKRYPALGKQKFKCPKDVNMDTTNMKTVFAPLPAGTVFSGKLRYHNLRPIELGALIWTLQMHSPAHYCHTIGMAKPYGYGRIKIYIDGLESDQLKEYSDMFQQYVLEQVRDSADLKSYQSLPEIKSLLDMAMYDNCESSWDFSYMELEDFSYAKGNKQKEGEDPLVLEPYPTPRPIPKPKIIEEKTLSKEEDFLKRLTSLNMKNAIKEMKAADYHFTPEQIGQIRNKYKNELKNKYLPDAKNMNDLLEKASK